MNDRQHISSSLVPKLLNEMKIGILHPDDIKAQEAMRCSDIFKRILINLSIFKSWTYFLINFAFIFWFMLQYTVVIIAILFIWTRPFHLYSFLINKSLLWLSHQVFNFLLIFLNIKILWVLLCTLTCTYISIYL